MIFIDSNIWCYYLDQRLPEHVCVRKSMREILKSEEIVNNTIIVMEVSHYIVRHFVEKIARKKIDYFVNLGNMKIADFNRTMLNQTIASLLAYSYAEGLGGRDATVIASMQLQYITKILSHDSIFKRLAKELEIEVIDPAQPTRPRDK